MCSFLQISIKSGSISSDGMVFRKSCQRPQFGERNIAVKELVSPEKHASAISVSISAETYIPGIPSAEEHDFNDEGNGTRFLFFCGWHCVIRTELYTMFDHRFYYNDYF